MYYELKSCPFVVEKHYLNANQDVLTKVNQTMQRMCAVTLVMREVLAFSSLGMGRPLPVKKR